jgi:UDP-N-acetylglucosamine 1-carboxyvinyltransferase
LDKFRVNPSKLDGRISVSGSKNSALPIIAASLLAEGDFTLRNVPLVSDVYTQLEILRILGAHVRFLGSNSFRIDTSGINSHEIPFEIANRSRGSITFLGSLLSKLGKIKLGLPGGDVIGPRPLDIHVKGLVAMGAKVTSIEDSIEMTAEELKGTEIFLDRPSTSATENLLIAATIAKGRTILQNTEKTPEISDLANFLRKMGAKIEGEKTGLITIDGVEKLEPANHEVIPDPLEADTYLAAAVITKGNVVIENANPNHMIPAIAKLREMGAKIWAEEDGLHIMNETIRPASIYTCQPYPAFQTDMQPIFTAVLTLAQGTSTVVETVWPQRFCYTAELRKMNAQILINSNVATIKGVSKLAGANVKADDIRGGASLVVAALAAEGSTDISGIEQIDRGYEKLEDKLSRLGADIRRV